MHLLASITPFIAFFMAFKSIFVHLKYRMSFEIKSHKTKENTLNKIQYIRSVRKNNLELELNRKLVESWNKDN